MQEFLSEFKWRDGEWIVYQDIQNRNTQLLEDETIWSEVSSELWEEMRGNPK